MADHFVFAMMSPSSWPLRLQPRGTALGMMVADGWSEVRDAVAPSQIV